MNPKNIAKKDKNKDKNIEVEKDVEKVTDVQDFTFENAINYCKAFSFFDEKDSQCSTCDNIEMKTACKYFFDIKQAEKVKEKASKTSSREIDFFDNSLTSNAHVINDCLLFSRLTIKEIAEKAATKESRVNSHLSYLKSKQSHKMRVLKENKKVFVVLRTEHEKKFNDYFTALKVNESK